MTQEERIIQTATEQFLTFGIRSVSMDDIASNLAISKKTIYKFFKDKKAIVKEVTSNLINQSECSCTEKCEQSETAIDELLKLIDFINSFFTNMNSTVMYDLEKYYPQSYSIFQKHQSVFMYESLINNLKRGIEEDLYRKDLDFDLVAKLRMGQVKIAFDQELFPSAEYDVRKTQLASLELYMMGITTIKGRELIEKYTAKNEK